MSAETPKRYRGKVIRWVAALRYGWVRAADIERDVHISYTDLPFRGHHVIDLKCGEEIEFEIAAGTDGRPPCARNISFVENSTAKIQTPTI